MEWQTLKVEENRDDHYAIVSFNRPEAANALSTQMAKDIISVMEYLTDEIDIWAVILTGSGEKAFCAGADLKERKDMTKDQIRWQRALFVRAFQSVLNFPKPIIAAVNGFAMGGGFDALHFHDTRGMG
ncbi:MAG: enoyl-CoA hydratase/isomerase family protein, partial [Clostridia bacterium]|nr:enoyl-CoA hydratase/isomerase family protein [Clostridia bacterium]